MSKTNMAKRVSESAKQLSNIPKIPIAPSSRKSEKENKNIANENVY